MHHDELLKGKRSIIESDVLKHESIPPYFGVTLVHKKNAKPLSFLYLDFKDIRREATETKDGGNPPVERFTVS